MRIIVMAVVVGVALAAPVIGPVEAFATQQDSKSSNTYPPRPPSRWWTIDKYKTELKLWLNSRPDRNHRAVRHGPYEADKEDLDRAQIDFGS